MNKLIIVSYLNFLKLKENSQKVLAECDDFLVSINEQEYMNLSDEDKKKLKGVALTDEKHNTSVIETVKPEELSSESLKLYLKDLKPNMDIEVLERSYREKHLKYTKPYYPKNIINKNYNSKKRGGR